MGHRDGMPCGRTAMGHWGWMWEEATVTACSTGSGGGTRRYQYHETCFTGALRARRQLLSHTDARRMGGMLVEISLQRGRLMPADAAAGVKRTGQPYLSSLALQREPVEGLGGIHRRCCPTLPVSLPPRSRVGFFAAARGLANCRLKRVAQACDSTEFSPVTAVCPGTSMTPLQFPLVLPRS